MSITDNYKHTSRSRKYKLLYKWVRWKNYTIALDHFLNDEDQTNFTQLDCPLVSLTTIVWGNESRPFFHL